eukprot:8442426-Pyramimonas_sp.AAC.1
MQHAKCTSRLNLDHARPPRASPPDTMMASTPRLRGGFRGGWWADMLPDVCTTRAHLAHSARASNVAHLAQ